MQQGIEQWKKVYKVVGHPELEQTSILTRHIGTDKFYLEVRSQSRQISGPLPVTPEVAERCVHRYGFKLVDDQAPARKRKAKLVS